CNIVISEFGSNATDDTDQINNYQRQLGLFTSLGLNDCIAWMWRADDDRGGPDLPGVGWNLAKDIDGKPRPAFSCLHAEPTKFVIPTEAAILSIAVLACMICIISFWTVIRLRARRKNARTLVRN
ncbi:hypothetical protein KA005_82955, partial [bacterium]|nr:hypothetical protein [bacterium]